MTPKLLKKVGEVLFPGRNWKSGLAKALNVCTLTVERWAKGDYPIPDDRAGDIYDLVHLRLKCMKHLIERDMK
jgi:hypothetical protein